MRTSNTLKGIAEVIEAEIIPDLSSAYPKAQSHAIVSMLRSLAIWQRSQNHVFLEENRQLERILKRILSQLGRNPKTKQWSVLARRIDKAFRASSAASPEERNSLLRELLDDSLLVISSHEGWNSDTGFREIRTGIRKHLKKRIASEMSLSTPSKMAEFSKGTK